ncbi:hypothetical protein NFI96_013674 [Prochilodus magdalenae]|nr:hypothetical protein NFI96_013674 [Prochilodus magdalenae]
MDTDEATLVFQKYDEMMDLLNNHCVKVHSQWTAKVDTDCQFSLDQPVLRRNPKTRVFTVNFSEQLVAVVREVKYLQGQVAIPPCASDVFAKHEIFRKYVGNLNLIVSWYNQIQATILSVELALVKEELKNIDEQLACAENSLCWNSEGVWDYIQKMRNTMHEFHSRLETAKTNVKMIHDIMDEWAMQAMFQRKDNKKESLLDLDGRQAALEKMYNNIKESGEKLHDLIAENKRLFRAEDCNEAWLEYVDYIDDEVLNGFFNVVHGSLNFLIENMLSENKHPLFEVRFELEDQKTAFYPSLAYGISDSLYDLVIGLINDIYKTATLVPRMSVTSKFSYQVELEEISLLKDMHEDIMNEVVNAMNDAQDYCKFLYKYADLWQDDRDKFMEEFLFYDRVLTPEEIKVFGTDNIPTNPPTLREFKDMIDTYESLYIEVKDLENSKVLRQWLQIDIKPFKHALLNVIKRWSWMFKQHLIDKVTDSLRELETFIKEVKSGLDKAVSEDLVGVMGHLKRDLPEHWSNVKKTALQVRQNVAPLQVQEVNLIRKKYQQFEIKQLEFREKFRQQPFFLFTCQSPYQALDKAQNNIAALEAEMEALFKLASLFEVFQTVPDYKQLKACQKDIVLLKNLWDKILLGLFTDMLKAFVTGASLTQVKGNMEDWKTTLWKNINLDQMEMESKKYAEDILGLDKEMRSWDAFTGLDNLVKNLITTLRTLRDLCNPAIKDRHWVQLMMATKLTFKTSNKTTFEDLLKLNLHKFEDEVHSIVDQAMNECEMEKILHELNNIWTALVFENEPHCRTGIMLLKPNNELVKALQDSQVQLQTLMTSKYIAHFLEDVSFWQQRLSTAESVISIWFRVQRTWTQLESIFIGSEDIRSQLPEDSKRFDVIDTEFKDIMANVVKTANVVESTNKKGLLKKLEHLEAG